MDRHEGVESKETSESSGTGRQSNEDDKEDSAKSGAGGENEGGVDLGKDGGSDESADGEGDEGEGEEVGGLGIRVSRLCEVVDEEGTDGDLGTSVAELGNESEDGASAAVDGDNLALAGSHDAILLRGDVELSLESLFRHLGELGEDEEEGDDDSHGGDGEVNVLHIDEVVGVGTGEEELGGDQRSDERGDSVP